MDDGVDVTQLPVTYEAGVKYPFIVAASPEQQKQIMADLRLMNRQRDVFTQMEQVRQEGKPE